MKSNRRIRPQYLILYNFYKITIKSSETLVKQKFPLQ